jgi:hypothetical protein
MSSEDHCIDAGATDQVRADLLSPARCDPLRNTVLAGSSRHGPAGTYDELPEKLIEAWARWAASRLS